MRKYGIGIAVLTIAVLGLSLRAAHGQSGSPSRVPLQPFSASVERSSSGAATSSGKQPIVRYTLPPDLYQKAHDRSRIRFRLELVTFIYGLAVLWIILHWRLGVKYRDWAEKLSRKRFF